MKSSEKLYERAKMLMPGGVNSPVRAYSPYPFFARRAKGSKLVSIDGDVYIDYCMAYGPLLFGHSPRFILNAVERRMRKGTMYGVPTEEEVEVAEIIHEAYPSVEMLRLVSTGGEATMHAIRLARGYTKRSIIVKFEGCYHGAHDSMLVKAGSGAETFGVPSSEGVLDGVAKNTLVLPFNDETMLEEVFAKEGDKIAGVIVEPVMGNIGPIPPKKGFLEALRKVTNEAGALLIFDEVITGFRLALGGAQEYFGVQADLTTLGKVLGGGFPIAAFGGRRDIMSLITPLGKVYQAGTYSGNLVSVSAALAVLRRIKREAEKIYPKLRRIGEKLRKGVNELLEDRGVEAQVNGLESFFQVYFTSKPVVDYASAKASNVDRFWKFFRELLKRGVFIPPSQFETCFISTAHTREDIEETLEAVDGALKALKAS